MEKEVISVIVPVYNVEKYIRKCLDSIVSQTYSNLQIILIDDGSTDNSGIICDEYGKKDSRIQVIHQTNQGLSSARNKGLDIACGEYIGFVDSDDYIEPKMYELLHKNIIKSNADICLCRSVAEDINGKTIKYSTEYHGTSTLNKEDMFNFLSYNREPKYIVPFNKLYKSKIFERLRYVEGVIYEDERIITHIYEKCNRIALINNILYHYIVRPNSTIHQKMTTRNLDAVYALLDRVQLFNSIKKQYLAKKVLCDSLELYKNIAINLYMRIPNSYCALVQCKEDIISEYSRSDSELFSQEEKQEFNFLKKHFILFVLFLPFSRFFNRKNTRS